MITKYIKICPDRLQKIFPILILSSILLFLGFAQFTAKAVTITTNTSYSTNTTISDGLIVNSGVVLDIDDNVTVTVTAGTVTINGTINIGNNAQLLITPNTNITNTSTINIASGGIMQVNGTSIIAGTVNLGSVGADTLPNTADDVGDATYIYQGQATISGTVNVYNGSTFTASTSGNSDIIVNGNTGTLNIYKNSQILLPQNSARRIIIGSGASNRGTIRVQGTETEPVIFSSRTGTVAGSWAGIRFDYPNIQYAEPDNGGSKIEYALVRYGGLNVTEGTINVRNGAQVGIYNTTIQDSISGISLQDSSTKGTVIIDTVTIHNTNAANTPIMHSPSQTVVLRDITISGSSNPTIGLIGGMSASNTIPKQVFITPSLTNVPYRVVNSISLSNSATLTIPAGVIIKYNANTPITATNGTTISLQGTHEDPIILTHINDTNNNGTETLSTNVQQMISSSGSGIITAQYVNFHYFGQSGGSAPFQNAGLVFTSSSSSCINCTFKNGYGAIMLTGAITPTLSNITYENVTGAPIVMTPQSNPTLSGTFTFTNSKKLISLSGVVANATLPTLTWPTSETKIQYYIPAQLTIPSGVTVNIPAGTVFKAPSGHSGFVISANGTLNVNGSSENPVITTSYLDDAVIEDIWNDGATTNVAGTIRHFFDATNATSNLTISHAQIKGFGISNNIASNPPIRCYSSNCTLGNIAFIDGYAAIEINGAISPTLSDITYTNVIGSPIFMFSQSNPTLSGTFTFTNSHKYIRLIGPATDGTIRNKTWGAGEQVQYYIAASIHINNDITVNVDPGVVFKVQSNQAAFQVNGSGTLNINGETGNKVIFTSARDDLTVGDIMNDVTTGVIGDGSTLISSTSNTSSINVSHAEFKFFGFNNSYNNWAAIQIASTNSSISDVHFNNGVSAVSISNTTSDIITPTLTNISFTDVIGSPIYKDYKTSPLLFGTFTFTNSKRYIGVVGNIDQTSATLPLINWPNTDTQVQYLQLSGTSISNSRTLTIEPGVVLKFYSNNNITISNGANFSALGESNNKIYFTSYLDDSVGGDIWNDGLTSGTISTVSYITSGLNATSTMEIAHAVVKYGGSTSNGGRIGMIEIGGYATISHIRFEDATTGISINATSANNATISDLTWHNVAYPLNQDINTTPNYSGSYTKTGTGQKTFYIQGLLNDGVNKTLPLLHFSDNTPIVYTIVQSVKVPTNTTLNIDPGVMIKFGGGSFYYNSGLDIEGGTLNVNGTSTDKVYFTATGDDSVGGDTDADIPGVATHEGMAIEADSTVNLNHLVIKVAYSGGPWTYARGAIDFRGGVSSASLNNVSFTNNARAIYIDATAIPVITTTAVDIRNHTSACNVAKAVHNMNSSHIIDLTNVYWGDASGPLDDSDDRGTGGYYNPAGAGSCVSDYIIYSPWAEGPLNLPTPPTVVRDGTTTTDIDITNSATTLSANWTAVAGVTSYEYAIGTSPSGTQLVDWTDNGNINSFTRNDLTLVPGTTYYVSVRSINDLGTSTVSSSDGILSDSIAPSLPTGLGQFQSNGSTAIIEGEIASSNTVVYKSTFSDTGGSTTIYMDIEVRQQSQSFTGTSTNSVTVNSYTSGESIERQIQQSGLTAGNKYKWRVRARDLAGNTSAWVNFGEDDDLFDFKVSEPTKFLFVLPGQTFTNGVGVSGTPNEVQAGANGSTAYVYAVDDENRRITYYNANIALSTGDTTAVFNTSPPGTVNISMSGGQASFTVRFNTANTTDGWTITVHQNSGAITLSDQESDAVIVNPGEVNSAQSSIEVNKNSATADNSDTVTITITLRDALDNPVSGKTVTVASTGSNNTLTQPTTPTDANGQTTATLKTTRAETKTISALDFTDNISITQTVQIIFVPGEMSASQSLISVSPSTRVANDTDTATITVTLRDAYNNPISGKNITLSATGTGNTLVQPTNATNAAGQTTGTIKSSVIGAKIISAIEIDDEIELTNTATVTFVAGPADPDESTITVDKNEAVANNTDSITITAIVRDSLGNPISGKTVLFEISGTNNTLSLTSGSSNSEGKIVTTLTSTKAETKTIKATITTDDLEITDTVEISFVAGNVSAANSLVSAIPNVIKSNNIQEAAISITLRDQYNNPISGKHASFTVTGSGNTVTQPSQPTNAGGVTVGYVKSNVAEVKTIAATVTEGDIAITQTASLTVQTLVFDQANSEITTNTSTVTADNTAEAVVTITLRDDEENPVPGKTITISVNGSGNTITQPTAPTDENGQTTARIKSTKAEIKVVTATNVTDSIVLNDTETITFVAGEVHAGNSEITANILSLQADGTATSTITVTLRDQFGNPVSGKAVALSATGSDNTLTQPTALTNVLGATNGAIKSTKAEIKTITAYVVVDSLEIASTLQITFVSAGVSTQYSTIVVSPSSIPANGNDTATITVTLRDANQNTIAGQEVTFTTTGTDVTITRDNVVTNEYGVITAKIKSNTSQEISIIAQAQPGSIQLNQKPTFTFTPLAIEPTPETTPSPTPTTIQTPKPTILPTQSPMPSPSVTPSLSPTPTPSPTPEIHVTLRPGQTPTPTPVPTIPNLNEKEIEDLPTVIVPTNPPGTPTIPSVEVVITDENGNPIADAIVLIPGIGMGKTDEDGILKLTEPPMDEYQIIIKKDGNEITQKIDLRDKKNESIKLVLGKKETPNKDNDSPIQAIIDSISESVKAYIEVAGPLGTTSSIFTVIMFILNPLMNIKIMAGIAFAILSNVLALFIPHRKKRLKLLNEEHTPVAFAKVTFIDPKTKKEKIVFSDFMGGVEFGKIQGALAITVTKNGYETIKTPIQLTDDNKSIELLLKSQSIHEKVINQMPFQVVLKFEPSILIAIPSLFFAVFNLLFVRNIYAIAILACAILGFVYAIKRFIQKRKELQMAA